MSDTYNTMLQSMSSASHALMADRETKSRGRETQETEVWKEKAEWGLNDREKEAPRHQGALAWAIISTISRGFGGGKTT